MEAQKELGSPGYTVLQGESSCKGFLRETLDRPEAFTYQKNRKATDISVRTEFEISLLSLIQLANYQSLLGVK